MNTVRDNYKEDLSSRLSFSLIQELLRVSFEVDGHDCVAVGSADRWQLKQQQKKHFRHKLQSH